MKFDTPLMIYDMPSKKELGRKYSGYHLRLVYRTSVRVYWRTRLGEAQNWRCCWCGCRMTEQRNHRHSATIEHIQPRSLGGADDPSNYAVACAGCNHRRGTLSVEEFMNNAGPSQMYRKVPVQTRDELRAYGLSADCRKKVGRRLDQLAAMKAAASNVSNPFEPESRASRLFERYQSSPNFGNQAHV